VSGDAAKAEKLREMWKSTGKDDAYIDSQLTSCLSMKDARVAKAAEARQKAETSGYQSLIDDIMSDGFSKEMAVGAVDSYISRQKSKDASEAQSEDDGEEASVSIYSNQDVVACLQSDDISGAKKIINYLVDERVKNGKTKAEANASIKSSITSKFKPLYVAAWKERDQSEMTRIRKLLIQSGLYGKSADIDELLKGWRMSK
jgi:Rod binding domain-containing protein